MNEIVKDQEKKFNSWLDQFVEESGHSWGMGFFVKLNNGEVLYAGTDEYKNWYDDKLKEYLNSQNDTN